MKKIKDILRLRFITNISYRQISRAVNTPSSTAADYCKRFGITNYSIDEFLSLEEDEIYKLLFPEKSLPKTYNTRPKPNVEDFIRSHVTAFEFYEGIPKILVPDNLKSAIISNNKKGIVFNENYAELSRHYNFAIEPARVRKPQEEHQELLTKCQ